MDTVQNGKGDSPRNNWGPSWYNRYDEINWHRPDQTQTRFIPSERSGHAGSQSLRRQGQNPLTQASAETT
jgi:hypothetical protein